MSVHGGPGYVGALVVSLFPRSLLRHHMFDGECGRRRGPPDEAAAPAGMRAIIRCYASQNGERINPTYESGDGKLVGPSAAAALA